MSQAVPLRQAARELGKSEATVRRWVRDGAPTAVLGSPGRGRGSLVVVQDLKRWRAAQAAETPVAAVSLEDLKRFLEDFWRARDHALIGVRDQPARLYLDALLEYVSGRLNRASA